MGSGNGNCAWRKEQVTAILQFWYLWSPRPLAHHWTHLHCSHCLSVFLLCYPELDPFDGDFSPSRRIISWLRSRWFGKISGTMSRRNFLTTSRSALHIAVDSSLLRGLNKHCAVEEIIPPMAFVATPFPHTGFTILPHEENDVPKYIAELSDCDRYPRVYFCSNWTSAVSSRAVDRISKEILPELFWWRAVLWVCQYLQHRMSPTPHPESTQRLVCRRYVGYILGLNPPLAAGWRLCWVYFVLGSEVKLEKNSE